MGIIKLSKYRGSRTCQDAGIAALFFVIVVSYLILGAFVFRAIETQQHPDKLKQNLTYIREEFVKELRGLMQQIKDANITYGVVAMSERYLRRLREADGCQCKLDASNEEKWEMRSAIMFCLTIVSTIVTGYGNVVPVSYAGKITCVVYAVVGIPMFLIFLAKAGDVLAALIRSLNKAAQNMRMCSSFKKQNNSNQNSKNTSMKKDDRKLLNNKKGIAEENKDRYRFTSCDTFNQTPNKEEIWNKVIHPRGNGNVFFVRGNTLRFKTHVYDSKSRQSRTRHRFQAKLDTNGIHKTTPPRRRHRKDKRGSIIDRRNKQQNDSTLRQTEVQQRVDSPQESEVSMWVPTLLFLCYLLTASVYLTNTQSLSYLDALYFSFITFTTIGFGDVVLKYDTNETRFASQKLWVLIPFTVLGLILVSTCINLSLGKVTRSVTNISRVFKRLKRKTNDSVVIPVTVI